MIHKDAVMNMAIESKIKACLEMLEIRYDLTLKNAGEEIKNQIDDIVRAEKSNL